ncbi:MAG: hypothetical protein HYT22_01685 [Candidatus Niyogibacteria bacterium]|nr:hypothetical protein [Candidatus Niyogibacteria bacterium]
MTSGIKSKIGTLAELKRKTDKAWNALSSDKRAEIEKKWDVEHAYYSSTLEGNGLDRKKFEELARKIK